MVVGILKFIGPFLRINTLKGENIEKQLSFFARESFKHITLSSRCGIITPINDFKLKNIPNFDINTFKKFSPLLCVYKKANPKVTASSSMSWDENTFKKEIVISSNAFMTLTCLELVPYYTQFKDIDSRLYAMSKVYSILARKQLDFYTSYLRNSEGVFVDKKDNSDHLADKYSFEDKSSKFKYSDQALLMSAFYKCGCLPDNKDGDAYKSFALDILKMLIDYKSEIYNLSLEETNKLCLAINIFCKYSDSEDAKLLLLDLSDLLIDKMEEKSEEEETKVENSTLLYLNLTHAYENTKLLKHKEYSEKIYSGLMKLYDNESGIFLKDSDKKEFDFTSEEIIMYLLCVLEHSKNDSSEKDASCSVEIYKRQLINSGIVLSWPETPTLDSPERYRNFSLKSEDLIDDHSFRMPSIPTPESSELAPIFTKSIQYSRKKEAFSLKKNTFDSSKNMALLFMLIYLLGNPPELNDTPEEVQE
jgi:hypothetical protein